MRGKGDSLLEFLMTYGWALIIVLAAVFILWFLGAFDDMQYADPSFNLSEKGQFYCPENTQFIHYDAYDDIIYCEAKDNYTEHDPSLESEIVVIKKGNE